MKTLGVCYDAGVVKDIPWRPNLDAQTARREMEIIRHDLHCTAVRVVGRDVGRLQMATEAALGAGLDVWFSPAVWDRGPDETIADTVRAARAAERLRSASPGRLTFVVGGELTLFMRGILPGRTLTDRLKNMMASGIIRSGGHNQPLNASSLGWRQPSARSLAAPSRTPPCPGSMSTGPGSTSSASTTTVRSGSRNATSRCSPRSSRRASRSSTPSSAIRRVLAGTM
jgi:hypothetical protein